MAHVLSFRIGAAASQILSDEVLGFYDWVLQQVFDVKIQNRKAYTIPIANEVVVSRSHEFHTKASDGLSDIADDSKVVLVDLNSDEFTGQYRAQLFYYLLQALEPFLETKAGEKRGVLMLVPELPQRGEGFYRKMGEIRLRCDLVLIAPNGEIDHERKTAPINAADYSLQRANVLGTPVELFRKKLIQRLGHFDRIRNDDKKYCSRYFYDGSFCVNEVTEILKSEFTACKLADGGSFILYHSVASPWLASSVTAFAEELNLPYLDVTTITSGNDSSRDAVKSSLEEAKGSPGFENFVLITDVFDSGKTLREVGDALSDIYSFQEVIIFAALATEPVDTNTCKILKWKGEEIQVRYFLKVLQETVPKDSCKQCADFARPYCVSHVIDNDTHMLSSSDFWHLAKVAGIGAEQDVPPHREGLLTVPRFAGIVRKNGSWIASKIAGRLASRQSGIPTDAVIVCPEEDGAMVIADRLKILLGFTPIFVPRDDIQLALKFHDDVMNLTIQLRERLPQWYVQICGISPDAEVIVIDEFNFSGSGGTAGGLVAILQSASIAPSCYFPMIDFQFPSEIGELPVYSLYGWRH